MNLLSDVRLWLSDLVSDQPENVLDAAQSLIGTIDSWPADSLSPEVIAPLQENEENELRLGNLVCQVLAEKSFPAESTLKSLLQRYLTLFRDGDADTFSDIPSLENWESQEATATRTIYNATSFVLMNAGLAGATLRTELLELLARPRGDSHGICRIGHYGLAVKLLADGGHSDPRTFSAVLDVTLDENLFMGIDALIIFCHRDMENFNILLSRTDEQEGSYSSIDILYILAIVACHCPEIKPKAIGVFLKKLKEPAIYIAERAAAGLVALNAVDENTEKTIRQRRMKEQDTQNSEKHTRPEFDFDHPVINTINLLDQLNSDIAIERARAAESLWAHIDEPGVVSALLSRFEDEGDVHDFDVPAVYVMRSLSHAGERAAPAIAILLSRLQAAYEIEITNFEKNMENATSGDSYQSCQPYELSDLATLAASIGPKAGALIPVLNKLERFLTLRDIAGKDLRIETIRNSMRVIEDTLN